MARRKKNNSFGILLVIILVIALGVGVLAFYDKDNGLRTFVVEIDGKTILSGSSNIAISKDTTINIIGIDSSKIYTYKVLPNKQAEFSFRLDGQPFLFSQIGDLSSVLIKEEGSNFVTLKGGMYLQEILEQLHKDNKVEMEEQVQDKDYFILVISDGTINVNISFRTDGRVQRITLDKETVIL